MQVPAYARHAGYWLLESTVFTLVLSPFVLGLSGDGSPARFLALPLVLALVGGNAVLLFGRVHRVARDAVREGVGEAALVGDGDEGTVDWWAGGEEA